MTDCVDPKPSRATSSTRYSRANDNACISVSKTGGFSRDAHDLVKAAQSQIKSVKGIVKKSVNN